MVLLFFGASQKVDYVQGFAVFDPKNPKPTSNQSSHTHELDMGVGGYAVFDPKNLKSTSNQSSKPCTVLQYPSTKGWICCF